MEEHNHKEQIKLPSQQSPNTTTATAIPFVYLENDKFHISKQAQQFLKQIKNPVAILTIVGKYRTGKSLFLNKIMLNKSKVFKVSPTINSCTKGLWLWKDTLKVKEKNEEKEKEILIIDTEGFGATEETDAYNNKILLFALLLSSYFVYNSVGSIDQNSLNNISVIANLANQIQSKNTKQQNIEQHFPTFLWLVRDFTLNLVDKNNFPIQPKQYLQQALQLQKGTSNQIQSKNRIRRMIRHFFKDRDCFTLVRPVETEDKLQQLDYLSETEFRQSFVKQSKNLRQRILGKIKTKKIKNTQLTGQSLFEIAQNYVEVVNNNSLPNFQSSYKHLIKLEMMKLKRKILQQNQLRINQFFQNQVMHIPSLEEYNLHKQQHIASQQKSIKNLIKLHPSLSGTLSSQQTSTIISQSLTKITQLYDTNLTKLKQKTKKSFLSSIQKIKQDNSTKDFYDMKQNQFKSFLNNDLQSKLKKKIQQISKQYGQLFIKQLQTQHWHPYILQIQQQYKQISYKRLQQTTEQLSTKLQMKEQQCHQQSLRMCQMEKELRQNAKIIAEMNLKNVTLVEDIKKINQMKAEVQSQMSEGIGRLEEKVQEVMNQKVRLIKELDMKNQELEKREQEYKELNQHFCLIDKQLAIYRQRLASKQQQLQHKTLKIAQISHQSAQKSTKIQTLHSKLEQLRITKQQLYTKHLTQTQKSSTHIIHLQKLSTKQSSQIKQLKKYLTQNQTISQNKYFELQQLYKKQENNSKQLLEMNNKLLQMVRGFEEGMNQYNKKEEKYKEYKKCMKNCSSIQCMHCQRFFMGSVFLTHLGLCTTFQKSQGILSNNSNNEPADPLFQKLQFHISNITINEANNKPCTIYQIQCLNKTSLNTHSNSHSQSWLISKKFTQLCDFHTNLQSSLPGIQLPESKIIFDTKYLSQKSLTLDQKKYLIDKYLNDLAGNPTVTTSKYWGQFVGMQYHGATTANYQTLSSYQSHNSISLSRTANNRLPLDLLNQQQKYNSSSKQLNGNKLNYHMKKSLSNLHNKQNQKNNKCSNHSLRKQNVQTPEQFFKIWQQKQLKSKKSSICLK